MRANKRDINQATLQRHFERLGALTFDTSGVGGGWADLVVQYLGVAHPSEVKSSTSYGRKGFNKNQLNLIRRGWVFELVNDEEDVESLIEKWKKEHDAKKR